MDAVDAKECLHPDRIRQFRDRRLTTGLHCQLILGKVKGPLGQQNFVCTRQVDDARGKLRGLAYRAIVHAKSGSDRADHRLPGVNAYANIRHFSRGVRCVHAKRSADTEGRLACAHRVILMRDRRSENCHYPVAQQLTDGSVVATYRLHHQADDRIDQGSAVFQVVSGQDVHGHVKSGIQNRDKFALPLPRRGTFQKCPGVGRDCDIRNVGPRADIVPGTNRFRFGFGAEFAGEVCDKPFGIGDRRVRATMGGEQMNDEPASGLVVGVQSDPLVRELYRIGHPAGGSMRTRQLLGQRGGLLAQVVTRRS